MGLKQILGKYGLNCEKLAVIFSLIFIAGILVFKFVLVFTLPLGFNEGVYGLSAMRLDSGETLYKDFFDHKPPFIYYSTLVAIKILGSGAYVLHLFAFIFDILVALSLFMITRHYLDIKKAVISCALYLALSGIGVVYLDTEIAAALFGLLGVFLYLKADSDKLLYFFSGIFVAISIWFKQTGVVFFAAIFIYELYKGYKQKQLKEHIKTISLNLMGILIISIPLSSLFLYKSGYNFIFDVILFNMKFEHLRPRYITLGKFIYLALTSIGILLVPFFFRPRENKNEINFLKTLLVLTLIMLAVSPEIFYNHFLQIFPFVVLFFFLSLNNMNRQTKKFVCILVVVLILILSFTNLEKIARDYTSGDYERQDELIKYLKFSISENDVIFADNSIYFYYLGKENPYITGGIAPAYTSVFDYDDFCSAMDNADYLILTHRQNFLSGDVLNCTLGKFNLEKRFENVGESFVEVWKANKIT